MKKNILLLCVTLILCLIVLEVFWRYRGTCDTYGEKTGMTGYVSMYDAPTTRHPWYFVNYTPVCWKGKEFTHAFTPNNEGVNDHDFVVNKTKRRIMVMGDSFVQGMGADRDSTLSHQIGYMLSQSNSNVPTEVWNCGIAGSDPVYEYKLFHDILLKYDPDMVVVVINSSDVDDVMIRGGFERFLPDSTVRYHHGPWFEPLYARSYLVRSFTRNILGYSWQLIPWTQIARETKVANSVLSSTIDSFYVLCRDRNIKLTFCFHPLSNEFQNFIPYRISPLLAHCYEHHLPYVDMASDMIRKGYDASANDSLYWPIDGHFKNAGYHYLAQLISQQIAAMMDSSESHEVVLTSKE